MPVKTAMRSAEFSAYLFVGITNELKIQPVNKPQDRLLKFEQPFDRQSPLGFLVFSKKLLTYRSFSKP